MKTNSSEGVTVWLTGLSGAGKTTISNSLSRFLEEQIGIKSFALDGDKVRTGINKDLKFSKEDRNQNIRRVGQICKLCNSQGMFVISSCISPYAQDRIQARKIHQENNLPFYQIFVNASLQTCQKRDTKGLYKLARQGKIPKFTGISDPYEAPENPDLILQQQPETQLESLNKLINFLKIKGHIKSTSEISQKFIGDYLDFQAGIQELNILQTIQQGWTHINNVMSYNEILECIYYGKVTQGDTQCFQTMPLFFLCSQALKQKADLLKTNGKCLDLTLRIISKIDKKQVAVLKNIKFEKFRSEQICSKLFGTYATEHPSIESWMKKGQYILSGQKLIFKNNEILFHDGLDYLRKSPNQIQKQFKKKNGSCLYAFQFRNPLHNGHLYLLHGAKKQIFKQGYQKPVLLLHPCGGWVKADDVPLNVRIKQHQCLLQNSIQFGPEDFILAIWPSPMFYAGPRQVLWHFSSRQKAGVNFMIVGRDPAGIKHPQKQTQNLYDQYDGQRVLQQASKKGLINIKILPFKQISWNKNLQRLQEFSPQRAQDFENISGSQMRKMAKQGQMIPQWFMNNKSWNVLSEYYKNMT